MGNSDTFLNTTLDYHPYITKIKKNYFNIYLFYWSPQLFWPQLTALLTSLLQNCTPKPLRALFQKAPKGILRACFIYSPNIDCRFPIASDNLVW